MHVMAVILDNGNCHFAVAATKTAVTRWRKAWPQSMIVAWRYHDGSGWADGSPDAWTQINQIVGHEAEIVI